MASVKVTITLDEEQLQEMRRLVAARQVSSVSGFVQHAVAIALHDVAGWREMLEKALTDTGGPVTSSERAWADEVLGRAARVAKRSPRRGVA